MNHLILKMHHYVLTQPNSFTVTGLFLYFLTLLSFVYERIMISRERFKRRVPLSQIKSCLISVGNITLGGTGKTPMAAWIANYISLKHKEVGVVLRGYKRKKKIKDPIIVGVDYSGIDQLDYFGDEALLLADLCPHAKIVVCPDRLKAIERLEREFGCKIIILDDGFQQIHLPKFMDIVCLDMKRPFGNNFLIPRGNLREPSNALKRGTHFVFSKGTPRKRVLNKVRDIIDDKEKKIFCCEFTIIGAYCINDPLQFISLDSLREQKLYILSGIGNPDSLKNSLEKADIHGFHHVYPDHHEFRQKDIENIKKQIKQYEASALLTTEKDGIRLKGVDFGVPSYALETQLDPPEEFIKEFDGLADLG